MQQTALRSSSDKRWELYRLLSEPVRLRLLALAAEEELAIGELAELLGEAQPNVSRHVAPLKRADLLVSRREGTRALIQLADDVQGDPVVADALAAGRALCEADGSLARVSDVLRARDAAAREFFEQPGGEDAASFPHEIAAYLTALAPLLPHRRLAVDVGTGHGNLLDVLAPVYERVIGVDRAEAQLARARERLRRRGYRNVELMEAEIGDERLRAAVGPGADVVFASRMLHHAPKPGDAMRDLAALARPGGAVVVIDYVAHEDEAMRERQADLWLGFEPGELERLARQAGLDEPHITKIPATRCGEGPDGHLDWQTLTARRPEDAA